MTLVHLKGFLYPPPSRPVGAGDAIAFPDFDRSVNAISTGGGGGGLISPAITSRAPLFRIFKPSYGPAVRHHHFMHSVEPSCSAESAQCQVNIWKGSFFSPFLQPRLGHGCLLYSLLLVVQVKILVIFFTFFSLDSNQQSY